MTTPATGSGVMYPARYYDCCPTWYAWNKLTAADVSYKLRQEPGFEGQNIWFWLNHPIQWVRLVGFICQIDMVAGGKYVLMNLDDGSGVLIELKLERYVAERTANGHEYSTLTTVQASQVTIAVNMGLPTVFIQSEKVELGMVVKAEGTIESYKTSRQLIVQRIEKVKDTHEEAVYWSKTADWKRKVLGKPWVLSDAEKQAMDVKLAAQERRELKEERHHRRKRADFAERRKAYEESKETKRKLQEIELNKGALKGSEVLKMPWDD